MFFFELLDVLQISLVEALNHFEVSWRLQMLFRISDIFLAKRTMEGFLVINGFILKVIFIHFVQLVVVAVTELLSHLIHIFIHYIQIQNGV